MNETKDGRHEISWTEKLSHYRSTTIPLVACCKNDQIINLVISDMYINLKSWKSGNGMLNHEIWLNIATISKMWPSKNMSLMRRKVWPTQNKTPHKNCPAPSTCYAEVTQNFLENVHMTYASLPLRFMTRYPYLTQIVSPVQPTQFSRLQNIYSFLIDRNCIKWWSNFPHISIL